MKKILMRNILNRTEKQQEVFDKKQRQKGSLWNLLVLQNFCFHKTVDRNKSNAIVRDIYLPD